MTTSDKKKYWNERAKKFGSTRQGLKAVCSYGMPSFYNAYIDAVQKKALSAVLDVKKGDSVLELGCGVGRWSLELAKQGAQVTAVDLSEEMIRIASRKAERLGLSIPFIVSNVADLRVGTRSFDTVLAVTVFQHILSPEELRASLAVVGRALKPGGRLILLEVAPERETGSCNTNVFKARTSGFYEVLCAAEGLALEDVRSVDPAPFKKWIIPRYRELPVWVRVPGLALATLLSIFIDMLFAGTKRLAGASWHKVMVFRKV